MPIVDSSDEMLNKLYHADFKYTKLLEENVKLRKEIEGLKIVQQSHLKMIKLLKKGKYGKQS